MNPYSAIVLYFAIWFLTALVMTHVNLRTQEEDGDIVPGTPRGAPANFSAKRLMLFTTLWGTLVWAILISVIIFSGLTVRDIDFMNRMSHHAVE